MNQSKQQTTQQQTDESLHKSLFVEPNYISRLQKYIKVIGGKARIDETKTLLFKQGRNPVYSDSIYIYLHHKNGSPIFYDIDNPDYLWTRSFTFKSNLIEMLQEIPEEFTKIGWIVIHEPQVGVST